jgi:hypothetical protein
MKNPNVTGIVAATNHEIPFPTDNENPKKETLQIK